MTVQGMPQLRRRLKALADRGQQRQMMGTLGLLALRFAKQEVPVKTRNLSRTIRLGRVTDDEVQIVAGGTQQVGYAVHVHEGTRPHIIRPRRAKALRWAPNAADRRLTGSVRSGAARAGRVRFAKVVHHPGTKANPFLRRGAEKAMHGLNLKALIVARWNRAA